MLTIKSEIDMHRVMKFISPLLVGALVGLVGTAEANWGEPSYSDLQVLESHYRIDSAPSENWAEKVEFMKDLDVLDSEILRTIEKVICGAQNNRSVLLIGDGLLRDYVVARMGVRTADYQNRAGACSHYLYEVDTEMVEAGNKFTGEVEQAWKDKFLNPVKRRKVVLYFPDLAQLIGKGTHSNSDIGIEAEFARNISSGDMKAVAYIDSREYARRKNSRHGYVLKSFHTEIRLPVLSQAQTDAFIRRFMKLHFDGAEIPSRSVGLMRSMSEKHLPLRSEPERSLSILDALKTASPAAGKSAFSLDRIRAAVLSASGAPQWYVDQKWDVLKNLKANLMKRIVGQSEVVEDLVKLAQIGYMGERSDERPMASVLFAGPTGLGKSFIPKQMAKALGIPMVVIDMTQYTDAYSTSRFVEIVANALNANPYSILLFEEIDKASVQVLDKLYFLLDEGIFYDMDQKPLYAGGAFVILTTNAGEHTIVENRNSPDLRKLVMNDLAARFRPSFLNRFDTVSIFKPFTRDEFLALARIMVKERQDALVSRYGWNLVVDEAVFQFIATHGQSAEFGARPMKRLIDRIVEGGIAEFQLTVHAIPLEEIKIEIKVRSGEVAPYQFAITVGKMTKAYTVDTEVNSGE